MGRPRRREGRGEEARVCGGIFRERQERGGENWGRESRTRDAWSCGWGKGR